MTIIVVIKDTVDFLTQKDLLVKEVLSRTEGASRDESGHCSQVSDKLFLGKKDQICSVTLMRKNWINKEMLSGSRFLFQ